MEQATLGVNLAWPATRFAGEARFHGVLAVCEVEAATAAALLPLELVLANPRAPRHPLMFVFGEQRDCAAMFGGRGVGWGIGYEEFVLALPSVRRRGSSVIHTFVPLMGTSYFPANWNGNVHYGFGKRMVRLSSVGGRFEARDETGRWLMSATVASAVGESDPELALRMLLPAFASPILGRKENGRFVRSHFGVDLRGVPVRAVAVRIAAEAALAPGLPPGEYAASAAVEVDGMLWRLGWPEPLRG